MPVEFTTTQAVTDTSGVKSLIYGPAGIGKTVLCVTAPQPVILAAESGLLSLRKKNLERLFGAGNPAVSYDTPVIPIHTEQDLDDAYNYFAQAQDQWHFQSLQVDSLTEIAEQILATSKRSAKDPRQAYGELYDKMEDWIKKMNHLPGRNVTMTAKMELNKDELTGTMKYGPGMPGNKFGPRLPYLFDEVFYLGTNKTATGEDYRFLQTQPDLQHDAKDRSGSLDVIEPPFLSTLYAKILGD